MEGKYFGRDVSHVERFYVSSSCVRQSGLDEEGQRGRGCKKDISPDSRSCLEPKVIEESLKEQREDDTPKPCGAPHDTISHPFALGKPLVNIQYTGAVSEATANAENDPLRSDKLRHTVAEGAHCHGQGSGKEPHKGEPSSPMRVEAA